MTMLENNLLFSDVKRIMVDTSVLVLCTIQSTVCAFFAQLPENVFYFSNSSLPIGVIRCTCTFTLISEKTSVKISVATAGACSGNKFAISGK